jgi:hypothetical protein
MALRFHRGRERRCMPHEAATMAKEGASMPVCDAGGVPEGRARAGHSGNAAICDGNAVARSDNGGEKVASMPVRDAGGGSKSRTHAASSGTVGVPGGVAATANRHACRSKRHRWRKKSHRCRCATLVERRKVACVPLEAAALPFKAAPSQLAARMHAARSGNDGEKSRIDAGRRRWRSVGKSHACRFKRQHCRSKLQRRDSQPACMPLEPATLAKKVAAMPVGDAGGASGSRAHAASSGSVGPQEGHACRFKRQRWRKKSQ